MHRPCITGLPLCRFVLYVWNTNFQLRLLNKNLEQFMRPNGLEIKALSNTIKDALDVTAFIGERYLWVDALCIIQDSKLDKASQISQTDKIYRGAALTIAAAGGHTNDHGLPGVRYGSRSPAPLQNVRVRGLHLQSQWPDLETILKTSKWNSRGWTYQEMMMSKRLLIFTACQVFCSCETDCQAEDTVWEVIPNSKTHGFETRIYDFPDWRSRGNHQPFPIDNDFLSYKQLRCQWS